MGLLSTLPASATCNEQIERLRTQGFVVVHQFVPQGQLEALRRAAEAQLSARRAPMELEADLRYPGAPSSRTAEGGQTVRRLLDVYDRDPVFAEQGRARRLSDWMHAYFREAAVISRAHHNCLMTKHPRYGSLTGWHRDIRYWSFQREDLVSVWIAIGQETAHNGALWFVPKSNCFEFDEDRFDQARFFRTDRPDNAQLVASAESPRLDPGDAVFFHCNTLHSAGTNLSDAVKFSLVYTYHGHSNRPIAGSRSASLPEVALLGLGGQPQ